LELKENDSQEMEVKTAGKEKTENRTKKGRIDIYRKENKINIEP
jgi:tRNA threonylcarbamoyladenosine modification (KEOPS) complex  Pcc1 subunit